MKLIGIITGEFEGNKYAKLVFTDEVKKTGCYGLNAIISKAKYDYVMNEIVPNFELFKDQDIENVYYDRFGRVSEVKF